MKTVFLLRHAKSSWDDPGLPDYQRPLAPRGEKAAPRMGRFMGKEGLIPERVLCSGALRARQTWELAVSALGKNLPTEIRPEIYHSTPETLLDLIHDLPGNEGSVLLVGHNPTFQELALLLLGQGDPAVVRDMAGKFPTAALAVLDFQVGQWNGVQPGQGRLRAFIRPKSLAQDL